MSDLNETHKQKIRDLWNSSSDYCDYIEYKKSVRIQPADLIAALMEATGKTFEDLALEDWDKEKVLRTVVNSEVLRKYPVIQEEVVIDQPIIPDNVIRSIDEERVKFRGEKWVVHKNDPDPFPSNPHAHNYEAGLKLHLGNGELYRGTKLSGKVPCKKLKMLRSLFSKTRMPKLEC